MNDDYKIIRISKNAGERAKLVMPLIGCRSLTTFVSMAILDYARKIENENNFEVQSNGH